MRNLLLALVVVGLLAAPSLGVINVRLVSDKAVINEGEVATISLQAQGTAAGIAAIGGTIGGTTADGGLLASQAGTFAFVDGFISPAPFNSVLGAPGVNGGWIGFGSQQTNYLSPSADFGRADYVTLATYNVVGVVQGNVTLAFTAGSFGGFKPVETNKSSTLGTLTPATIQIVPEPATMALLALGGLLVARRRAR